jgi:hypothetical protein
MADNNTQDLWQFAVDQHKLAWAKFIIDLNALGIRNPELDTFLRNSIDKIYQNSFENLCKFMCE